VRLRLIVAACCLLAAACAAQRATNPADPSDVVTVFAAASLADAFDAMAAAFERANPGTTVTASYASSSTLATQITQGAPADVFASANHAQMGVVADAGLVGGGPVDVAGTTLEIVVEAGNPLGVRGLTDLARDDVTVVLAAEDVPAGQYARQALDALDLDVRPASLEPDVRAVLARVALGEADAGIVYRSDVATAGDDVDGVAIPADQNVPATYPIAVLRNAPNPATARAFVDFVRSDAGRRVLRAQGFEPL
jgi:molybdate transport system substrate-binding protein